MQEMIDGDLEKRKLRGEILKQRSEVGYPYIFFRDTVNKNKPEVYKDLPIVQSNMCAEIMLPNNADESFVCCLSSINILHRDEIIKTDAIETMTYFLDTVMEDFIQKLEAETDPLKNSFMERPLRFAKRHRAIGIGVLGWHAYLQNNLISFESEQAKILNKEIFKILKEKSYKGSKELADIF